MTIIFPSYLMLKAQKISQRFSQNEKVLHTPCRYIFVSFSGRLFFSCPDSPMSALFPLSLCVSEPSDQKRAAQESSGKTKNWTEIHDIRVDPQKNNYKHREIMALALIICLQQSMILLISTSKLQSLTIKHIAQPSHQFVAREFC